MRVLLLLMLSLPLASFAEEDFDSKYEDLHKDLETKLMHARVKTKFKKYPNPEYIKEYNNVVDAHIAKELALHKEFCKKDGDKACLSEKEVEEKKAQYKVVTVLENRKNDWAIAGLSDEQIKKQAKEYNECFEKDDDKDCFSLPVPEPEGKPVKVEEADSRDVATVDLTKKKESEETESEDKTKVKDETKVEVAASKEKAKAEPEVVEEGDDEKTPRNYKPETCRWVNDLPRKIVNGPGCGPRNRSKICTGYVICEQKQGGAKFIRMSTCGADKCGPSDEDAVRCTKDMGYYSMRPQGESKLFMSPELKKILSGGATRQ